MNVDQFLVELLVFLQHQAVTDSICSLLFKIPAKCAASFLFLAQFVVHPCQVEVPPRVILHLRVFCGFKLSHLGLALCEQSFNSLLVLLQPEHLQLQLINLLSKEILSLVFVLKLLIQRRFQQLLLPLKIGLVGHHLLAELLMRPLFCIN